MANGLHTIAAHSVLLADRQHFALDAAVQDGIGRLFHPETRQPAARRDPLRVHDLRDGKCRRSDRTHLPRAHQVGEGRQGLLDVGVRRRPVDQVEIDMVGLQSTQGCIELADEPASRIALVVRIVAHGKVRLGGQHDVVAPPLESLADDLLGFAVAVHVGRVDEVDPRIDRLVDDSHAVLVVGISHPTEHHRAQAIGADLDAGSAQCAVLHLVCSSGNGRRGLRRNRALAH
jgi:hypothetical protein